MLEISIVIPVFNSEDCLEELCRQIYIALKDFVSYEVILVNDQSHDNSWQKIAELANTNRNIKGINLRKNSGQDNALMAGLRISSGSYIVIMDDDLSIRLRIYLFFMSIAVKSLMMWFMPILIKSDRSYGKISAAGLTENWPR